MRFSVSILFIISLLVFNSLKAQDIHWSQFNFNPLFQNPANTGNHAADIRLTGNYRNQWKSVTLPFSTFNVSYDEKWKKNKQFRFGGLLFHDVAGDGKFRTIECNGLVAYAFKWKEQQFQIGLNVGIQNRQINYNLLSFGNQYNGITYDPTLPSNENYTNQQNTNLTIGTGITHQISIKKVELSSGFATFNLNQPNQGFYGVSVKRSIRTVFHSQATCPINAQLYVLPSFQLTLQGKYRELVMGGIGKYYIVQSIKEKKAVFAGIWWRNKDAFYLSAGLEYTNWLASLSYDVNVSKLVPASNFRGGIEFAVQYFITRFSPKKVTHRICPDYL